MIGLGIARYLIIGIWVKRGEGRVGILMLLLPLSMSEPAVRGN